MMGHGSRSICRARPQKGYSNLPGPARSKSMSTPNPPSRSVTQDPHRPGSNSARSTINSGKLSYSAPAAIFSSAWRHTP
jgi:hypothetical protein